MKEFKRFALLEAEDIVKAADGVTHVADQIADMICGKHADGDDEKARKAAERLKTDAITVRIAAAVAAELADRKGGMVIMDPRTKGLRLIAAKAEFLAYRWKRRRHREEEKK